MKISRIVINGFIIFIGLALYFLLIEALGLSDQIYLRLLNFIFVIYGVNRTLKSNYNDGIYGYFTNLMAAIFTALTSLVLGLISFVAYLEYKGGEAHLYHYADSYVFGGDPNIYQFMVGLAVEGIAASVIISFALMQYWKDKVEKINNVDDIHHNNDDTSNI